MSLWVNPADYRIRWLGGEYIPADYDDALQFSSVLSLEYALKGIVPELQAAVGGTPATAEK